MARPEIRYALPVSCLEVSSTITAKHDTILDTMAEAPVSTVALHTHGITRNHTLQIKTGALLDTSLSFGLTEDGLLASVDAQSTGQLGRVLVGVVGAGVAVASVLAGAAPVAGAAVALAELEVAKVCVRPPAAQPSPEQLVAEAYSAYDPAQAALRARYTELAQVATERIAGLAKEIQSGSGISGIALAEIRREHELLTVLRGELDILNVQFATWRAGTITTRITKQQRCFSLDVLREADVRISETTVKFSPGAHESVRFAWSELGVAVQMDPAGARGSVPQSGGPNSVLVRLPRRVRLGVYENVGGRPVLREERPYLVVDAACETQRVRFRRSLWAKRSTKLSFGRVGSLTGYAVGSASSAVAVTDAAGQLTGQVASDLAEGAKVDEQLTRLAGGDRPPDPRSSDQGRSARA